MPASLQASDGLTIAEIARLVGVSVPDGVPADFRIHNVAPLDTARAGDVSFLDKAKHLPDLAHTRAAACFILPHFAASAPSGLIMLLTDEPYRAFVMVTRALFPKALRPSSLFETHGRAGGAQVHSLAWIEAGVTIDPLAVVGPRAEIGAGSLIAAGAVIGPDVCIGRDCAIGACVTVTHALIGDRVIVHPGARIGQNGFGYLPSPKGHQKIPQTGRVIIQDDVEIGANTTIDRGATRDTVIGEGSKIDNLVQIGHNVAIGRHCLIAGQTGISESARVGDFVMMASKVDIARDIAIGANAVLEAQSGVLTDVPADAHWSGTPAQPVHGFMDHATVVRRVGRGKDEGSDS